MNAALTGQHRFGLMTASRMLGVGYQTLRKYVVELRLVPSMRRGVLSDGKSKPHGCKILIDENGLAKLREMFPSESYGLDESVLPRSSSTGSA
jgi:hypothetical protein